MRRKEEAEGALLELPQREQVTCEHLDMIVRSGHTLLKTFAVVEHDLALMAKGVEIVFAIDFSEIFTFLWPEKSRNRTPQLTRALFDYPALTLTLPPGATVELLVQLRRLLGTHEHARKGFEDFLRRPMVSALIDAFDLGTEVGTQEFADAMRGVEEVQRSLQSISTLGTALDRLSYLERLPNLRPFDTFLQGPRLRNVEADPDVLRQCMLSLNLRRPDTVARNNYIDAHNYALVWAMSNAEFPRGRRVFTLVTSSPVPYYVFKRHLWSQYPDILPNHHLPELPLVRHPIQFAYLSRIHRLRSAGLRTIRQLQDDLGKLLRDWGAIPEYQSFLARDRAVGRGSRAAPTTPVTLPRTPGYLKRYVRFVGMYNDSCSPVREAMESDLIAEENVRLLRDVDVFGAAARVGEAAEYDSPLSTTRVVFDLFDRLTRATSRTIEALGRDLKTLPTNLLVAVDAGGILGMRPTLVSEVRENVEFSCAEFVVREENSTDVVFAGDIFDDYHSIWWRTDATLREFLAAARRLVSVVRSRNVQREAKRKKYLGVYLFMTGRPAPVVVPLERFQQWDVSEILESDAGRGAPDIHMLRIGLEFCDVCYDLVSYRDIPQRAGVVSHVRWADELGALIASTATRRANVLEISQALEGAFAEAGRLGHVGRDNA